MMLLGAMDRRIARGITATANPFAGLFGGFVPGIQGYFLLVAGLGKIFH